MIGGKPYSFSRHDRLLRSSEFEYVFARVKHKIRAGQFTLLVRENNYSHSRIGLIVAKRKIKKATARQRIKRLIRESFRLNKIQISHWDIICIVQSGAGQRTNPELFKDLEVAWKKLAARPIE